MASTWSLWMVLLALGVGPALVWTVGSPRSPVMRRALAVVLLGLALVMLPHVWGHVGLATVPAALIGLGMAHLVHHASRVGAAVTALGVALLSVHMLLDGSALAVHDEAAMPWLIGLHRLPVGIAIMAMAIDRYGPSVGRLAGTLVIVGLMGLTALGFGLARHYVGEGSELVSGLVEAWVLGAMAHVVLDALGPGHPLPGASHDVSS